MTAFFLWELMGNDGRDGRDGRNGSYGQLWHRCIPDFFLLWEGWEPAGGEGEYGGESDAPGLFWGEAVRPADAMGGVGTVSMVVVFVVAGGGLALRFPVVPSFGTDVASHLTVHEEGVAIITPWSAKIDAVHTRGGDEPAVVEHISIELVAWGGCRGDVGVGEAHDCAILKPSR
jgi:hypothetical protein